VERLGFEVIYTVLPEKDADRVVEMLKGYHVSFNKSDVLRWVIPRDYGRLRQRGLQKPDAVRRLCEIHECHPSTVYRIINEEGIA